MNHLAHALLAQAGGDEFALGCSMGDFVHGRPNPQWPIRRRAGLLFHRAVDRATDQHPQVLTARRRYAAPWRRYAGILLDVWFDHLLVRDWPRYSAESLPDFCARWLDLLDRRAAELPGGQRQFLGWMHAHGLPLAYGDLDTLVEVLRGLAARLSRPSPIAAALPQLLARADALQADFDGFFPQLLAQAASLRAAALARAEPPPGG